MAFTEVLKPLAAVGSTIASGIGNVISPTNFLLYTGLLNPNSFFAYKDDLIGRLSGDTRNQVLAAYQQSIGATPLNTMARFKAYQASRKASLPAGVTFVDNDLTALEKNLTQLDTNMTNIGAKIHPDALNSDLQKAQETALRLIEKQNNADIKAITDATHYTTEDARTKALNDLKAAQAKSLETFKEGFNDDITMIHQSAQMERDRVILFGTMRNRNEHMRKIIDQAAMNKSAGSVTASLGGTGGLLSKLTIDDLTQINGGLQTLTGMPFQVEKVPPNSYTFNLQLPARFITLHPLYYKTNQSKADFLFVAQLLFVSGAKKATVTMNYKNEKFALKLARQVVEACREAGFDEKSITVKVNGKTLTMDELYKLKGGHDPQGREMDHGMAHSRQAAETRTARADSVSGRGHYRKQMAMKQDLADSRKDASKSNDKSSAPSPK